VDKTTTCNVYEQLVLKLEIRTQKRTFHVGDYESTRVAPTSKAQAPRHLSKALDG
jgi:hypothetical protein